MPRYVIYARKSSDEKERQIKSIPDQIEQCRELAKRQGIQITEADEFRESKSAKVAGNRPIFNEIIKQIGQGKITGIICWHPDRLSRNGPEGGMLTGLLDQGSLKDLKFCTFNFENNTAGKMLLGIMFVMSKEYSDRLSDNIRRGVNSNLEQGKSVGSYKWGYVRNAEGYYEPHPVLFAYIKHAWDMRLENKGYPEIMRWLRLVGCERQSKKGNLYKMSPNRLTQIFSDTLYFGVLCQKDKLIDLREIYDFKPMVTHEEWKRCQQTGRTPVNLQARRNYYPFRDKLVTCACGAPCVPDRGKNYLYLFCSARKKCPLKQPRIRASKIIEAGYEVLKKNFNPSEEQQIALRVAYGEHVKRCITQSYEGVKEQRRQLTESKYKAEEKLHALVVSSLGRVLDPTERRVYEQEKALCQETIEGCTTQIARLEEASALKSFDYDEFSNFLKTAAASWKLAHGEALHQMATFLFSNFTINDRTVQNLRLNPDIEILFIPRIPDGGDAGN